MKYVCRNCTGMKNCTGMPLVLMITAVLSVLISACGDDCDEIVDPPPPDPHTETWDIRFIWDEAAGKYIHSTAEVTFDEASITIETDSVWSTYDEYPWDSFTATIWGGMYNDTLFLIEGRKFAWTQGENLDSAVFVYCHDMRQPLALRYDEANGTFSLECVEMVSKQTGVDGPYKFEGARR